MRSLGAEYSKAGDDGKAGAAAPRGLTPRGGEASTRGPRRVRGPPPRRTPQCEIAIAPHRRPAAQRERKQERKGLVLEGRRDLTDGGKSGERYGRRVVAPQAAGMEQAEEMKTANGDGEEDGGRPFRSFEHRRGFDAAMLARRRGGLPRPAAPLLGVRGDRPERYRSGPPRSRSA